MRAPRLIERHDCDSVLFLIDLGTAWIVKEFVHGEPHLYVIAASGRVIGTPSAEFAPLFEAKLVARSAGDGLFPGCPQTSHKPRVGP
jgi:hypothetical protein